MSYLEYFCNNKTEDNETIRGTCDSMCPHHETALREKEGLVHVLEVLGSDRKLVKSYSRSAADSYMAVPSNLRPFPVLKDTVQHLLLDVSRRRDVSTALLYDFLNDRLRAVRQDMTIQRLPPEQCMQLLEPMIRFYVYFAYKLYGSPVSGFDPVLNKKYLLECIKWFLHCCDVEEKQNRNKIIDQLTSLISDMGIQKKGHLQLRCDRVLVESLYILCNLDDTSPLLRYLTLDTDIKTCPVVRVAYRIAMASSLGNYVEACRLAEGGALCPLTFCAWRVRLPELRRKALRVMSHAYNSKQLTVPVAAVRRWLAFNNDGEVVTTCKHYGLQADNAVHFTKDSFNSNVDLVKPTMLDTAIVDVAIEKMLTYPV